ncbi:MAG: transcriptional repressor [Firmicutes bacterium]|jgi:Fur family ferric uptake transcriptional regulator|uniref:Transcriptional repressor n=1 Tax=Sulfobacillus benefaciens TaxID=453960 RepID=A0A2T2X7U9_9FIRM|nr:transcriptional repressor [Bacillota bacterium]MCL5014105.1 transcriptional repressor [Bacillota bacterium]PSR30580.1 MAG: transcriptional repressor [Sulfobacillus benefaciens]HBQ93855.1 transcriptional repressor [Sulfobacillus sp.]
MVHLSSIYRKLEEGAKRLTPQRELVIRIFAEHPGEHLSAEEVHQLVKSHFQDIGLATVYRSLELLTDLEILTRISFDDGRARYEFNQEETHRHHHLVCVHCGHVDEYAEDLLDPLEDRILYERGFQVLDHELKFYGLCRNCAGKLGKTGGPVRETRGD